jgi:hypothetical protein
MAMKIGGKYEPDEVYLRHWHRLVPDTAGARNAVEKKPGRNGRNNTRSGDETPRRIEEGEYNVAYPRFHRRAH